MEIVRLRLDDLTLDAENAKIHTDEQVEQIVESIRRYGFNDPIGVWGNNNKIVEGHGRYRACAFSQRPIPSMRLWTAYDLTTSQKPNARNMRLHTIQPIWRQVLILINFKRTSNKSVIWKHSDS